MPEVWIDIKVNKEELKQVGEELKKELKNAGKEAKKGATEKSISGGGEGGGLSEKIDSVLKSDLIKTISQSAAGTAISLFQDIRGTKLGVETNRDLAMLGSNIAAAGIGSTLGTTAGTMAKDLGAGMVNEVFGESVRIGKNVQQKAFQIDQLFQNMGVKYSDEEMKNYLGQMNKYERRRISGEKRVTDIMNEMNEFSTEESISITFQDVYNRIKGKDIASQMKQRRTE